MFVPDQVWTDTGDGFASLNAEEDRQAWLDRVYSDTAIITQVDDGHTPPDQEGRYASSSASMPSIVAMMLHQLDITGGETVLEIGTGTGWNAGLLATRLGADRVTSVEVDPDIAARGRTALARIGLQPSVVTTDGAEGYAPNAPYDRVIATAAVRTVPYAWVAQTRPGGVVVTPWGNAYDNGALARLRVRDDGTASGRFVADVAFMWLRAHRTPHGSVEDRVHHIDDATTATTTLHPYYLVSDSDASFAIGLQVPDCHVIVVFDDDDSANPYTVWFMHPPSESWASLRVEGDHDAYVVRQFGPRRLWNEIDSAYRRWVEMGRPERGQFGLTVTPDRQYVWLDTPDGPCWKLPETRQYSGP